jgi:hypothetical protein
MRTGIGTERPSVPVRGVFHVVQHEAGLDARLACHCIDVENAVEMFRGVDDDRDVAALAGDARSGAARGPARHADDRQPSR